jgi:hypothetical protein
MKKFLAIAAASVALGGISAPAVAQGYGHGYGSGYGSDYRSGYGQGNYTARMQQRIERGIQRGLISRSEASYLYAKLDQLAWAERNVARNGYDRNAMRTVRVRAAGLEAAIRKREMKPDYRDERWGNDRDRDWRYDD